MNTLGSDFNNTGSVMSRSQLEEHRKKRGECLTCGRKCFQKKLFKLIPITEEGMVLDGRCLNCCPLDGSTAATTSFRRRATPEDLERFTRTQSNLMTSRRNLMSVSSFSRATGGGAAGALGSSPPTSHRTQGRGNMTRAASSLPTTTNEYTTPRRETKEDSRRAASLSPFGLRHVSHSPPPPPLPSSSSPHHYHHRHRAVALLNDTCGSGNACGGGACGEAQSSMASSQSGSADDLASLPKLPPKDIVGGVGCPESSWNPSNGAIKRRSSTTDALHGGSPPSSGRSERISHLRHSRSGAESFPTPEEIERAQLTILAAKEHGRLNKFVEEIEEIFPLNDVLEHTTSSNITTDAERGLDLVQAVLQVSEQGDLIRQQEERDFQEALQASTRDMLMSSPQNICHHDHYDHDAIEDQKPTPRGLLNRGGIFPVSPLKESPLNHSFSRSKLLQRELLGSMEGIAETSFVDDDIMNGQYSTHDDIHTKPSANNPCHSAFGASALEAGSIAERLHLENLSQAGNNYGEILIIVREALESTVIVSTGLEQLARLQLSPEDQNSLGEMGLPFVIADAMHSHRSSLAVQLAACGAIWNMSTTIQNQVAFVDYGTLDAVLASMDLFDYNAELQEKAMAAITNLAAAQANLSRLEEKGVVSRIIKAMNVHSDVSSLQVKGCGAVTNFAAHDGPTKERMIKTGIGAAIVVAMVMHLSDPYVQEKALRALRSLCANSDINKAELAHVGGVDAVISAMQVHRDVVGVQREGAWAICTLAGNEVNKIVIGDCGGVDVVIRAMWVHSHEVSLLEWCCRALYTLSLDPQNSSIVLEIGGISAIVNSMHGHVDSQTVQEMGCATLGNLASDDAASMRIVDEEALDAIVLAMVLHTDDMRVQERACVLLMRLAVTSNYHAMRAANIHELVRTAARKFPDQCDEPAQQILHLLDADHAGLLS